MAKAKAADRRESALSRERIVDAAIELLDADGEEGLTFRALATRLSTGAGAIYWHIRGKDELLAMAADVIVARALGALRASKKPEEAIRSIAVGIFVALEAHAWLGSQLSRAPAGSAMLRIFEQLGRQVEALGVRADGRFTAASALLSYIVGVSAQNAANSQFAKRELDPSETRETHLAQESARWLALDSDEYAFTRSVAAQLRVHDDRDEYLAGIDLILAGIGASLRANRRTSRTDD
jgi:AcrR family transcriptional regulator